MAKWVVLSFSLCKVGGYRVTCH